MMRTCCDPPCLFSFSSVDTIVASLLRPRLAREDSYAFVFFAHNFLDTSSICIAFTLIVSYSHLTFCIDNVFWNPHFLRTVSGRHKPGT